MGAGGIGGRQVGARSGKSGNSGQLLDALSFEQVSATSAVQLIADIDGLRAMFKGKQVHFEPK
ncbi:MAG: hypothetical protein ACREPQ_11430 [Rhodanobacter sp.]